MRRPSERGLTVVELAIGFAILGSLLAIAVPAFVRDLYASRFAEPVDGLTRIGHAAVAYAEGRPAEDAFPPRAPLTPAVPPRGTREADAPGTWDTPTWTALDFHPVPEGVPHFFAFGFESAAGPKSTFLAHAHADLDGDGVTSTFELRGHAENGAPAAVEPGMYVEAEVE